VKRSFLVSLAILTCAGSASAAPTLRQKVDLRGGVVAIGHTMGYDCGSSVPAPMGATRTCTGVLESDTAPDGYWLDNTGTPTLDATQAATSAQLTIPTGKRVVYARLYWSALLSGVLTEPNPDLTIKVRAPGATTDTTFTATMSETKKLTASGPGSPTVPYIVYQSSVDVTSFVNTSRSGVYRVTDIDSILLNGVATETAYSAWTMVVVYEDVDAPYRQISLLDGLDLLDGTTAATATFSGFTAGTTPGASLTVWGYDGDHALTGDNVKFNATTLTNAINPATDFFNSSRSHNGVAVAGSVPAVTGVAGSMAGYDLDTLDVSSLVPAGSTTANVEINGSSADSFWLGGIAAAIESKAPLINATKSFTDLNGGAVLSGDVLEFTITATNNGDDTALNAAISDALPTGLTYVAGSLKVGTTSVTDAAGDDTGEFAAGTVTARVGAGASATSGGTLAPGASATITFRATVSAAPGTVVNTANVRAGGALGMPQTDFPTDGDPVTPGRQGTSIVVRECDASGGCVAPKVCDLTTHTCVDPSGDAGDAGDTGLALDTGLLDGSVLDASSVDTSVVDGAGLDTAILTDGAGEGGSDAAAPDTSVSDTGGAVDGSVVSDGGADAGDADAGESLDGFVAEGGGCGCRTTSRNGGGSALAALAIALMFVRRKR